MIYTYDGNHQKESNQTYTCHVRDGTRPAFLSNCAMLLPIEILCAQQFTMSRQSVKQNIRATLCQ